MSLRRLFDIISREISLVDKPAINEEFTGTKRAVPFEEWPLAPREREWSADEAEGQVRVWAGAKSPSDIEGMDFKKYAQAFGWFDEENPENLASYKLLHHDVIDGSLQTIFRGAVAARVVLAGGRGGVDIPQEDRADVEAHITKHIQEFGPREEEIMAAMKEMEEKLKKESEMTKEEIDLMLKPILDQLASLTEKVMAIEKASTEGKAVSDGMKNIPEEIKALTAKIEEVISDAQKRFESVEKSLANPTSQKIHGQDEQAVKSKWPSLTARMGSEG